jgi:hypothetical protein
LAAARRKSQVVESLVAGAQLGNAFNGDSRTLRANDRSQQEEPGIFNPYLGGRPPSTMMPAQMDPQQMLAMQMQMAQMNPAYMQMHQYA